MESSVAVKKDFSLYKSRRKELVDLIKQEHGSAQGGVLLWAGFEPAGHAFRQDSSFFYFTGITEPGLVLLIDLNGRTTLFVPQFQGDRSQWLKELISISHAPAQWGVESIEPLGDACPGYQLSPDADFHTFKNVHAAVQQIIDKNGKIFMPCPGNEYAFGG
ncbi:aminopeptidase P N-terminal domain-containing protein, partial [Methylicorpusculum sp.]|uniref:aminopeptidase P N-terminal domain-containing protein n=1 Tax=Methylicorpusculum sp. TaxID=2713644 RepID=UPI002AC99C0E